MQIKILTLMALGLCLALLAGGGGYLYLRSVEQDLNSARAVIDDFGSLKGFPVLLADAEQGKRLFAADFTTAQMPESRLPDNMVMVLPPIDPDKGLVALTDLRAGAGLLSGSIGLPEGKGPFIIALDSRILAVTPQNLADYGNRLRQFDLVDLFWTRNIGGGSTETRLIGNALRLVELPDDSGEALVGKILLEARAEDAARLLEAGKTGSFHIVPASNRLPQGSREIVIGPADLRMLPLAVRSGDPAAAVSPAMVTRSQIDDQVIPVCSTFIIRGGNRSMVEVPC